MKRSRSVVQTALLVMLTILLFSGCEDFAFFDPFVPGQINEDFPTRILVRTAGADYTAVNPDGKDWDSAFTSIQDAINYAIAHDIDEVWISGGEYFYFTTPIINITSNVSLFGGFKPGDVFRSDRKPHEGSRKTILNGTHSTPLITIGDSINNNTVIDGFDIYCRNIPGMIIGDSSPVIRNCIFTGDENPAINSNRAVTCNGGSPSFMNNRFLNLYPSSGDGGAISIAGGSPSFLSCDFTNNTCTSSGGALYIVSGARASLIGCNFTGNKCTGNGGAIYLNDSNCILNIDNCTFQDNTGNFGGAIHTGGNGSNNRLIGNQCHFFRNTVPGTCGGAIYSDTGSLNLNQCSFISNSCLYNDQGHGGAIYCYNTGLLQTLTNCHFSNNYSGLSGGAVTLMYCTNPENIVRNCSFENNHVSGNTNDPVYGGGISNIAFSSSPTRITISGCAFTGNTVNNANPSGSIRAGGIYCNPYVELILSDCTDGGGNIPEYIYSP